MCRGSMIAASQYDPAAALKRWQPRGATVKIDAALKNRIRPYIQSTIRLLESVPNQRPDPIAQTEAEDKIRTIEDSLRDYDRGSAGSLIDAVRGARTAVRNSELGLALAYMRRAAEEIDQGF